MVKRQPNQQYLKVIFMTKLSHWIKEYPILAILALLALVATIFAVITLWRFTGFSTFDSSTGVIGDTFGIMNPFIAIAAALITFAAFWVQFKANEEMIRENRKQQAISRFYEMLAIHRENIKELKWMQNIYSTKNSNLRLLKRPEEETIEKNGRQIFLHHLIEFTLTYDILGVLAPSQKAIQRVQCAYSIYYLGTDDKIFNYGMRNAIYQALTDGNIKSFSSTIKKIFKGKIKSTESQEMNNIIQTLFQYRKFFISQPPFFGHFDDLDNYYRHLFLMVKTVANEDEKYLPPDEKTNLLKILRAQLSTREQIILFYNWFSGCGYEWEEESKDGNHFFTKYRMIHNIMPHLMVPFSTNDKDYDKALSKFVRFYAKCEFIKLFGSNDDPIFEFEKNDIRHRFGYNK